MIRKRLLLLLLAIAFIALSWLQTLDARRGLTIRRFDVDGLPLLYLAPAEAVNAPGVLIAHGFAGSKQLMLGYAFTFAHAGYATLLWDFGGHGANPATLRREETLQANVDAAYALLAEQPGVDGARVAVLGHSMGSGAAMAAGLLQPERYQAVLALSPTGAEVSPSSPRNLHLQAGSWEGRFVANARDLLAAAGGERADVSQGLGRSLVIIPAAEHISILFRAQSHRAALAWLDAVFGPQRASAYVDRRILWYALHLLGWLLALAAVAPVLRLPATAKPLAGARPWLGLFVGPLAAAAVLAVWQRLDGDVTQFGGMLVAGALALWFGVAGLVWLGLQGWQRLRNAPPAGISWLLGLGLFALLWLAFGAMGQETWLQWVLIPARLMRWPWLALAVFPWFLAAGLAQQHARPSRRVLWWLVQVLFIIFGLLLALTLVPGLFILVLMMPLIPLLIGILAFADAQLNQPWAFALGSALFFGWVLAAVFPLAG